MPLKSLVVITIRALSIVWFVDGIIRLILEGPFLFQLRDKLRGSDFSFDPLWLGFAVAVVSMVVAVGVWASASGLAGMIIRGYDRDVALVNLSCEDLFRFAFIVLGLYFVLASVPQVFDRGFRFFAYDFPLPDSNSEKGKFLVPFVAQFAQTVAGLLCIFASGKWSRLLLRRGERP